MEIKIESNKENKLLGRKEITFSVDQENSTVRRDALTKELCKKLSLSPESTIVVTISQGFGNKQSTGVAHSYSTKEMLEKYEPKHVLARIAKKSAKKEGAEPKAEEAPAAEQK